MKKKIGVGIIGGGKAGRNLAQAVEASLSAQPLIFCTRHEKSAQEAARICGVPRWTTDYHTILDNFTTEQIQLKKGRNEVVFESRDKKPGKKIGIDFIWLRE